MVITPATVAARLDAADRRCECTGQCRRPHRKANDGRCHTTGSASHPLVLAPADPATSWAVAARLTPAELSVWCVACLTTTERAFRHYADARAANQDALFGDPGLTA